MRTHLTIIAGVLAVVVIAAAADAGAGERAATNSSYPRIFKGTPAPEVPDKAARIVAATTPAERPEVTVGVISYTVGINPASAPAIVGAVAKAAPEMATLSARTAARLQPKQVNAIACAAASAAPEQAGQIVEELGREFPSAHRDLARSVAQVVPRTQAESLRGVGPTSPALRTAGGTTLDPVTPDVPTTSPALPSSATRPASSAVRGPSVQGPYIPLPPIVTNAPPGSGEVPPGGRDYARP